MRWTCCILLASVTIALANDERPKRDLAYIKNLLTSTIFGACDNEVKEPKRDGVKFYKIPGHDGVLIKATPKLSKSRVVMDTVPRQFVARGEGGFEVIPQVAVAPYVPTPVGMKYSYEQRKSDGFTTKYASTNGGDVVVTKTKTMPPLPPYITRRIQDVLVDVNSIHPSIRIPSKRPILHPVLNYQAPFGSQAIFEPITMIEERYKTPTKVFEYNNMNPHPSFDGNGVAYDEVAVVPPNYVNICNQPINQILYPCNRFSIANPSSMKNNYSYKVINKDGTSTTYLGSEASDATEKNIHTVIRETKNTLPLPPDFIANRVKNTVHPIQPLNSQNNENLRFNLLPPLTRETHSLNKKLQSDYVYIPPNDLDAINTLKKETFFTYKQEAKLDEPAEIVNVTASDVKESLSKNPIVVPETKYSYKQNNADGSSINVKGDSDNQVSVQITENQDSKKGRGDIP